jgi:maltooligosyltrehalose trehalohydrolase
VTYDEDARWVVIRRGAYAVAVNLAGAAQRVPLPGTVGETLLASTDGAAVADSRAVDLPRESVAVVTLA